MYEHTSMCKQLYSSRYTQPIKAYNSVLNKTVHLFHFQLYIYFNLTCSLIITIYVRGYWARIERTETHASYLHIITLF